MLELNDRLSENELREKTSSKVERFMDAERSRTQKMIDRSPLKMKMDSDVSQLLDELQARFSHTDTISNEIEGLIEAQVKIRTQDLFQQANYDGLTHLPNRRYFHSTLESLMVGAKKCDGEFTLLFLDLDGFKKINDTFGHHAGDELLRNVSARVVSTVREGDIVSRLGGDEFVVLLAGTLEREEIESICLRMIREVSRPYWIDQHDIRVSTSIGVARYPMDAGSSSELVEKSDKALYASKDAGRNTFCFYSDLVACEVRSDCTVVDRLKKALLQGQIKMCFEPQVDLVSQKIVGASVSALWMESRLETPYLSGWMDALNQTGRGVATGTWLIDSGLYYLQQWQTLEEDLVISIPVISALCKAENMVDFMNQRLQMYQVHAGQVQLEFSLDAFADQDVQKQVNALSEAGYQITLTEIGKMPLDFVALSGVNVHEIKLDAKWLKEALTSQSGQKWLKAVVQMAGALDAEVIATGIESQAEMKQLQAAGCLTGQGILWALPVEPDGFCQVLRAQLPVVH